MKRISKKAILLLAMVLVILTGTVCGTIAWIVTGTDPVVNTFTPGKVEVSVEDNVSGKVKDSVVIKNTGNTDAYIRATIVANWVKDGKIVAAWNEKQGTFENLPGNKWEKGKDGYYYYTEVVKAGEETGSKLFVKYTAPEAPVTDAHLEMTILAQAIQSSPPDALKSAGWEWQPN